MMRRGIAAFGGRLEAARLILSTHQALIVEELAVLPKITLLV